MFIISAINYNSFDFWLLDVSLYLQKFKRILEFPYITVQFFGRPFSQMASKSLFFQNGYNLKMCIELNNYMR